MRTALNLLVETFTFRAHLMRYPISRDDNRRYTSRAYVLPNHGFMAKFTVPGMRFLLRWALNLIREWLVTPIALVPLLHTYVYLAIQVIIAVHQVHS